MKLLSGSYWKIRLFDKFAKILYLWVHQLLIANQHKNGFSLEIVIDLNLFFNEVYHSIGNMLKIRKIGKSGQIFKKKLTSSVMTSTIWSKIYYIIKDLIFIGFIGLSVLEIEVVIAKKQYLMYEKSILFLIMNGIKLI